MKNDAVTLSFSACKKRKRRGHIPALLIFLALSALVRPAFAEAPNAEPLPLVPAVGKPYSGFTKSFTLSELGWEHGVDFSGSSMDRTAFFGVPPSQMVEKGSVTFRYSYLPQKKPVPYPRLEVDVNETLLGTLPGPPAQKGRLPVQSVTFPIPPYLVTPLNSLRIRVAKDPKHPCSTIYAGHFIHIDPATQITLTGIRIHFPSRLSDLPLPFLYHAMTGVRTIPFLIGNSDIKLLEAAGYAASWFGVKSENAPLRFPVSVGIPVDLGSLPTGNLVLLASSPLPPLSGLLPPLAGPTLALVDNPADPYGKILLILGRTPEEVRTAALGLALGQFTPEGPAATFSRVEIPVPTEKNGAPRWIDTQKPVRLAPLASSPGGLEVTGTGSIPLRFSLPSDLFFFHTASFPLMLHYRYSTLPGEGRSRLDLLLNKKYQDSIPLPPESGTPADHYRTIPLKLSDLTPFRNVLKLNFNFRSEIPRILSCRASQNTRLRGTILADSSLDLHRIPHFVRLPNLQLVPNGGYPFTRYADLRETAVVLPETPGEGDIRIFLHLMAFLAQETGSPGVDLSVTGPEGVPSVSDRNLILIGTYDSNPLLLRYGKALPQDSQETRSRIRLKSRMEDLLRWSNPPPASYGPEALAAYFKEDRNPLGVMEEDLSPLAPRRVILSLGGVSEQSLVSMDRVLFDPQHFSDIFGQVSLVGPHRIHSFLVPGDRFSLGHLPPLTWLRFWFFSHPLGVLMVLLAISLLLAGILSRILSTLAVRRTGP